MMNLDEHKVYVDSLKMEMVPLSIAKQAVQDIINQSTVKLEDGLQMLDKALAEINTIIEENND